MKIHSKILYIFLGVLYSLVAGDVQNKDFRLFATNMNCLNANVTVNITSGDFLTSIVNNKDTDLQCGSYFTYSTKNGFHGSIQCVPLGEVCEVQHEGNSTVFFNHTEGTTNFTEIYPIEVFEENNTFINGQPFFNLPLPPLFEELFNPILSPQNIFFHHGFYSTLNPHDFLFHDMGPFQNMEASLFIDNPPIIDMMNNFHQTYNNMHESNNFFQPNTASFSPFSYVHPDQIYHAKNHFMEQLFPFGYPSRPLDVFHQRLRGQANNAPTWHAASQIVGKTLDASDLMHFDKPFEFVQYNLILQSPKGEELNSNIDPKIYNLYESPQELSLWTEIHKSSGTRTKFDPLSKQYFDGPVEYFIWQSSHKDETPTTRAKSKRKLFNSNPKVLDQFRQAHIQAGLPGTFSTNSAMLFKTPTNYVNYTKQSITKPIPPAQLALFDSVMDYVMYKKAHDLLIGTSAPFNPTSVLAFDSAQDYYLWNQAHIKLGLPGCFDPLNLNYYDSPAEYTKWNFAHKMSGSETPFSPTMMNMFKTPAEYYVYKKAIIDAAKMKAMHIASSGEVGKNPFFVPSSTTGNIGQRPFLPNIGMRQKTNLFSQTDHFLSQMGNNFQAYPPTQMYPGMNSMMGNQMNLPSSMMMQPSSGMIQQPFPMMQQPPSGMGNNMPPSSFQQQQQGSQMNPSSNNLNGGFGGASSPTSMINSPKGYLDYMINQKNNGAYPGIAEGLAMFDNPLEYVKWQNAYRITGHSGQFNPTNAKYFEGIMDYYAWEGAHSMSGLQEPFDPVMTQFFKNPADYIRWGISKQQTIKRPPHIFMTHPIKHEYGQWESAAKLSGLTGKFDPTMLKFFASPVDFYQWQKKQPPPDPLMSASFENPNDYYTWKRAQDMSGMKVPFKSTMLEVYDTPQDFFRWNLAAHNAGLQIPLNGNSKSFYDTPLEFKQWNDAHKLSGAVTPFDPTVMQNFETPAAYTMWKKAQIIQAKKINQTSPVVGGIPSTGMGLTPGNNGASMWPIDNVIPTNPVESGPQNGIQIDPYPNIPQQIKDQYPNIFGPNSASGVNAPSLFSGNTNPAPSLLFSGNTNPSATQMNPTTTANKGIPAEPVLKSTRKLPNFYADHFLNYLIQKFPGVAASMLAPKKQAMNLRENMMLTGMPSARRRRQSQAYLERKANEKYASMENAYRQMSSEEQAKRMSAHVQNIRSQPNSLTTSIMFQFLMWYVQRQVMGPNNNANGNPSYTSKIMTTVLPYLAQTLMQQGSGSGGSSTPVGEIISALMQGSGSGSGLATLLQGAGVGSANPAMLQEFQLSNIRPQANYGEGIRETPNQFNKYSNLPYNNGMEMASTSGKKMGQQSNFKQNNPISGNLMTKLGGMTLTPGGSAAQNYFLYPPTNTNTMMGNPNMNNMMGNQNMNNMMYQNLIMEMMQGGMMYGRGKDFIGSDLAEQMLVQQAMMNGVRNPAMLDRLVDGAEDLMAAQLAGHGRPGMGLAGMGLNNGLAGMGMNQNAMMQQYPPMMNTQNGAFRNPPMAAAPSQANPSSVGSNIGEGVVKTASESLKNQPRMIMEAGNGVKVDLSTNAGRRGSILNALVIPTRSIYAINKNCTNARIPVGFPGSWDLQAIQNAMNANPRCGTFFFINDFGAKCTPKGETCLLGEQKDTLTFYIADELYDDQLTFPGLAPQFNPLTNGQVPFGGLFPTWAILPFQMDNGMFAPVYQAIPDIWEESMADGLNPLNPHARSPIQHNNNAPQFSQFSGPGMNSNNPIYSNHFPTNQFSPTTSDYQPHPSTATNGGGINNAVSGGGAETSSTTPSDSLEGFQQHKNHVGSHLVGGQGGGVGTSMNGQFGGNSVYGGGNMNENSVYGGGNMHGNFANSYGNMGGNMNSKYNGQAGNMNNKYNGQTEYGGEMPGIGMYPNNINGGGANINQYGGGVITSSGSEFMARPPSSGVSMMYSDGTAGLNPMALSPGLNPMFAVGQSQSSLMEGAGQGEPMEGFEMTQTIPNNGMIKNSNSQNLPMEFSNMQQPGFMSPGYAIEQQQSGGRHPYYGTLEKKQQKEVPEKPEVESTKAFGKYGPGYAGQRRKF